MLGVNYKPAKMFESIFWHFILTAILAPGTGIASESDSSPVDNNWVLSSPAGQKITFDLNRVNADGLQGKAKGLRALHYEFCIPDSPEAVEKVSSIDPTLTIQGQSPGRIGCNEFTLLCLGHTHQPDYLAVLKQLAMLPFIDRIQESFFE